MKRYLVSGMLFACTSIAANAATMDEFRAETEILNLGLGSYDLLTVSATQTGIRNGPADPDIALAQVAADIDLGLATAQVDLGVLGVEWLSDTLFRLIFDLETNVSILGADIPIEVTAVPTINWKLSNLDFDNPVTGVTQVSGIGADRISFSQRTIDIDYDNLVGVGATLFGQEADAVFQVEQGEIGAVPLPAGGALLLTGFGAFGAIRRLKRRG
ncbi:VPLPA-CTERM sorting domain-containing protein [Palleronia sp. LCG004]|uniref:VPLPA-CTERM sorting domain-containing protein n=1 Tax=Palleronia sp. LCG004 TaxID=3079304 RepID=UPI002941D73E|nr:VPLPA-CTERM sorting domain-containing protein [Palleronia sp. LCG004]WOI55663.1 VPLPA-CTERM sorting domain-containing protein [Palleronia sp. LCG004]